MRLRSDDQLVELFRAGHEDAFRVIHDRYRARLFAYTRQMLPNSRQDAEDALQDVFIRAYSGLRASNRHLALRAWLYRVAHNRCIDQLRKNVPLLTEEIEITSQDVSTDPLAAVEQRDDLRKLVVDVQRLPEQQRAALLLREMSGMSYQELADSMELSVPAIKSLLVRARTGLTAAAEARNTDCESIRSEIVDSHERGARPNALTRRHLSDCSACRDYRESVREVSKSLAALIPAGPLVLGLKLLGVGSVYSAAAYSGSAGGGAAAASGMAAAGSAAAGGAAVAGGAAASGAAAGSVIAGGVSVTHIAAIIAAAAATAGGAVAVTHQRTTAHNSGAPTHPAAGLIHHAVSSGVSHGYAPAAVIAPVRPVAGATTSAAPALTPATVKAKTRATALAHTKPAGAGTASSSITGVTSTTLAGSTVTGVTTTPAAVTTPVTAPAPVTTPATGGTAPSDVAGPTGSAAGSTVENSVSTPSSSTSTSTGGVALLGTTAAGAIPASGGAAAVTTTAAADSTAAASVTAPGAGASTTPTTSGATTSGATTSGSTTSGATTSGSGTSGSTTAPASSTATPAPAQ